MAKTYLDIQNSAYTVGNIMDWTNALTRLSGVPVDITEVYDSYAKAVEYAAVNPVAYEGQLITVTENGDTTVYVITPAVQGTYTVGEGDDAVEYNVNIKKVGIVPTGDNTSITVTETGLISLFGFSGAENGMLPVREDGKLVWKTLEAIGAGDGNDNTTYEFELTDAKTGIIVTPLFNGQPIMEGEEGNQTQKKFELVLDVYTKAEADDKFLAKADYTPYDDTDLSNRVKAIEDDYLKEEDKYDDTALSNRVKAIEDDYLKTEDKYDDTALAGRVEVVEGKVATLEETVGNAEGGLVKDIADEIERAKAAEKELDDAIKAIDFVDPTELADAIKDFATVGYVDGEIDKIEEAIANLNHFKAEVVDDIAKVTEIGVLYLIKDESVAGVDKYNEYIVVDGQPVLIGDTTTDLSNYYNKTEIDGKVAALEESIADEATARGELADRVADLEAIETVTQSELETYKGEVTQAIGEAKQAAIDDADGKLALKANTADVVANDTFESFKTENAQAIADARTGAVADVEAKGYAVADEVAQTYATKSELEDHSNTMATTLNDYAKKADVEADLATKIDTATISHSTDEKAEGATVNGTQLDIVVDAFTKAETRQYVADTIKTMTGGESAADVKLLLENHIADYEEKVGQIDAKNGEQDTAIAAAQTQADKGVADAKTANDAIAALTTGAIATNTSDITTIKGRLDTLETAKGSHEQRLTSAESAISALQGADTVINETIGTIQGKITDLTNEDARLAGLIQANTDKFGGYYTKGEVDSKVQEAIDAIPEVDFTPYAKTEDVNAALALKADADKVYTKDEADAEFMTQDEVDSRINALIVGADPEGGKAITNIQNLVKYVDENAGEIAALITETDANTAKLAGIETTVTDYVSNAIAAIVQPKASAEVTVAEDGTLGIGEVNVNKLVQSEGDTFIIDGGKA